MKAVRALVRDLSIKNKLIGIVFLITFLALFSGSLFVILADIRTFRRDAVERTMLIARVMGDSCVSDLTFGDKKESEKTLARLASVPSMRFAHLYDAKGLLFSSYRRASVGGLVAEAPARPPEKRPEFLDGLLHVSQPVLYQGERYGTIYIGTSTDELTTKIRTYLVSGVTALVALLTLSVLAALRLQRLISEPILGLALTAKRISANHDYSIRVVKSGDDEIGALCDGFNEMLEQIQRRQEERDQADQRTKEKSLFLATMSHELRTPLNSIIGFSEILLTRAVDKLTEKELKFVKNINASGQHLLGIINNILDLSKIEAGKMEVLPEEISVVAVIEGVCSVMKGVTSRRGITLVIDAPDDLPTLFADEIKIKQIVYNLLSNAVKFSPDGSSVRVTVRSLRGPSSPLDVDAMQISVKDDGIGISAKDQQIIFFEFRQVDGSATRKFEGTGLGLALVRKFAELHGGTIEVKSALGQGSTFTVTLPERCREVRSEAMTA